MTVFVSNYVDGNPPVGVRIDTDNHRAVTWHNELDPRNLGPVYHYTASGLPCTTYQSVTKARIILCRGMHPLPAILWFVKTYSELVKETVAYTKLCDIYDRDEVLILRDIAASPWTPRLGPLGEFMRGTGPSITHSHVLAAMLMLDPIIEEASRV